MIKIDRNISCRCGNTYSTLLNGVVIEKDITNKISDYISHICPCGRILLVNSRGYNCIAIRNNLRQNDYMVDEITIDDDLNINDLILDEGISLIIGVGEMYVNRAVKIYSHINKIPNVFIALELDDDIAQEYISLNDNSLKQYKGKIPSLIIYDLSNKISRDQIAYYLSSLYFRLIALFDLLYSYKAHSNIKCDCIIIDTINIIGDFLEKEFDPNMYEDIERLINTMGKVICNVSYLPSKNDSYVETILRLLRIKYRNKSLKIISAYAVDTIYRFWLINSIPEISLPPDREYYHEKLSEEFNIDKYFSLNTAKIRNDYLITDYVTRTIKDDLMSLLFNSVSSINKLMDKIKDTYTDKGYHLKDIIDYDTLMGYMSIAAEYSSEDSLVKHIDKSGLLWHYVDKL